ncbi:Acyl carrier protein [Caulifigura coniformis]|uniref:Acyl carrier protein n=1 Tax=Caulifigura coniformis TaxID=2527983 RepID=A0A517SLR4_9PLAN|nr:acyl carrier protein [Caulifigura coniformis]QDT57066.1 Acyl carrier protein [Caulifigura coniformis]
MSELKVVSWEAVREIVADTLAVDLEEVTPESNFFADLGGESIDIIDLGFRCRQALGVTPQFSRLSASDWEVDETGVLLPESRRRIEQAFPLMAEKLPTGPFHWQQLFSVAAIWEIVADAAGESASP